MEKYVKGKKHNKQKLVSKKSQEKQKSSLIPGDIIIYDILTRIPPESLLRFRCVCKTWSNSFSNDPLFIKLHGQRYHKSHSSGFITIEDKLSLVFINHNDGKRRIIPFKSNDASVNVSILHSLDGVLLLRDNSSFCLQLYVYNPITCCSTMIPPMNDVPPGERRSYHCCLCYDPLIEKHKVVVCGPYQNMGFGSSLYLLQKIKILTVGDGLGDDDNQWRDVDVPYAFRQYHIINMFNLTVCPNGYLCRIVKPSCDLDECYILRLDVTKEVCGKIKLPNEVLTFSLKCTLNEMEGILCLSHYTSKTHELRVWTLQKKGCDFVEDENEWDEIRFNINTEERMDWVCASFQPLAILTVPKRKLIVAHYSSIIYNYSYSYILKYTYYSYDIELNRLEIIHGPTPDPVQWHVNFGADTTCKERLVGTLGSGEGITYDEMPYFMHSCKKKRIYTYVSDKSNEIK